MEKPNVVCKKCGGTEITTQEMTDALNRKHTKAFCMYCKEFIQFISVLDDSGLFVMPFGKHKGELLRDIPVDYLTWLAENTELRGSMKTHVETVLTESGVV